MWDKCAHSLKRLEILLFGAHRASFCCLGVDLWSVEGGFFFASSTERTENYRPIDSMENSSLAKFLRHLPPIYLVHSVNL